MQPHTETVISAPSKSLWPIFVGGIAIILLFAVIAKIFLGRVGPVPDEDAARSVERNKAYQELQTENQQKLTTYAWVDKSKGSVQIPIQQAMELTVAELSTKKPQPAGQITPAPSSAASPAAQADSPQ